MREKQENVKRLILSGVYKTAAICDEREKMAYRMMDIMELAMQKEQNGKNARMDHMIDNMICELRFEAKPLFAKRSFYGDMEKGDIRF